MKSLFRNHSISCKTWVYALTHDKCSYKIHATNEVLWVAISWSHSVYKPDPLCTINILSVSNLDLAKKKTSNNTYSTNTVYDGCHISLLGIHLPCLVCDNWPEFINIYRGTEELLLRLVVVSHTHFAKITRMTKIKTLYYTNNLEPTYSITNLGISAKEMLPLHFQRISYW